MIRPEFIPQRFPLRPTIKPANRIVTKKALKYNGKPLQLEKKIVSLRYLTLLRTFLNKVHFCGLGIDIKLKYPHNLPSGEQTCSNEGALLLLNLF